MLRSLKRIFQIPLLQLLSLFFVVIVVSVRANAAPAGEKANSLSVEGHFEQGGIIFGHIGSGEVLLDGKPLRLGPNGDFVFGIGRDAPAELELTLKDGDREIKQVRYHVAKREYKIQRVNGVQQKHVNPPETVLKRIRDEAAKVRKARRLDDDRLDFKQSFIWPLVGPITGVYGSQRVYNGTPKSPHYGVDIAAPVGTNVRAPAAGVVTLAEPDLYYSGGTLILDHGHGLSSTFIHLSKLLVKVGQRIVQGQDIAQVGATGRATGPHLDWRMNWFEVRVDPQLLMADTPMQLNEKTDN